MAMPQGMVRSRAAERRLQARLDRSSEAECP